MSKLLIRVLVFTSIAELCLLCPSPNVRLASADPPPTGNWLLVWSDEFEGTQLDTSKWGHQQPGVPRGGRNSINSPAAVSVEAGNLVMRTFTPVPATTPPHHAGIIQTGVATTLGECQMPPNELDPPGNKHTPLYGYIEASIDFDGASGMWHSFFLNTPNNLLAGPLDAHLRGMEMDIVEHKVTHGIPIPPNPPPDDSQQAPTAIHWSTDESPSICAPNTPIRESRGGGPHSGTPGTSLADGFHTYGLEWTPDYLNFYYDNTVVWRVNNTSPCPPGPPCVVAPVSHVREIIQLASEVPQAGQENAYGPTPPSFGVLDTSPTSTNPKMRVEYVRHYQLLASQSGLMATAVSLSQINLAWTDEHYPHPEDGFRIERSEDGENFTQIATVAPGGTYPDMGLTANKQYHYRVRAYKGGTNTDYSNTASAVTEVTPPGTVTNLAVPIVKKNTVAVTWSAPGDDGTGQAVIEYDLRYSTSAIIAANFGSATRVTPGPTPHMSGYPECFIIPGLAKNTTYHFAIKSKDDAGIWSAISNVPNVVTLNGGSNNISCPTPPSDGTPPASVTNLWVPGSGTTNLAVSWTAPGDDGSSGIASEYDFRYSSAPITASNFTSATRLQIPTPQPAGSPECFLVTGLATCAGYYFALKTRDELGNWSGISNAPNGATQCQQDHFAECSPGNPAAKLTVQNDQAPRLFSAPSPNPARGNTSFRISVPSESRGAKLRVGVFDTAGRRVRSLVDRVASPGPADIEWNLRDDSGRRVASGLYMMRIEVADRRETFRLVVVR